MPRFHTRPVPLRQLLRHPDGFLPLAMSAAALALLLGRLLVAGTGRSPDEGAPAHLWQLLIVGQVPLIALFALRWLRRAPRTAVGVLMLQVAAMGVAMLPVWALGL